LTELEAAYEDCMQAAQSHYENFPVASLLIPREYRYPVSVIYTFARRADDIADEGDTAPNQRIAELYGMDAKLEAVLVGEQADDALFMALHDTIRRFHLDPRLFHDLTDAFRQDVLKKRYQSFKEVLDYCRRSANPVGRLMLQLFNEATEENYQDSDRICSALQLINFMQDIQQDLQENGRIYLPQDEMKTAGITDKDLVNMKTEPHIVAFMHRQTKRAKLMMEQGAGLGKRLPGRFGLEIRAIIAGGLQICDALLKQGDDIYSRPRLTIKHKANMLVNALFKR